jgi:hypothetical protein
MLSRKYWFALTAALSLAGVLSAQPQAGAQTAPATAGAAAPAIDGGMPAYVKPETPEQRKARIGNDDPGLNPDPKKTYYRYGKPFHIEKYAREWASYQEVEAGFVRPFAFANFASEIYQQNEKYVWVWIEELTADTLADFQKKETASYTSAQQDYLKYLSNEFSPVTPPDSEKAIRFEESSEGLPKAGSWRNSMAVADMNGDGFPDIIVPPQRGGGGTLPAIFLGDGKGHWKIWSTVVWPYNIQYGNVVAADFNKDGKMDLAFGVHLMGVRVWLGDGKGNFTDASSGLPIREFPTRRIVVADLDADGAPDILAINEGPLPSSSIDLSKFGRVRGYLNRKKGTDWLSVNAADPQHILGGDWLAAGRFNRDKYPDFIGGSIFFQGSEILYRSTGLSKWEPVTGDGKIVPYLSYYYGVATARFSSKELDDAVMSYVRFWPTDAPKTVPTPANNTIVGIDRVSFTGTEPKRTPIVRFAGSRPVLGIATGDFDSDGKADLIYAPYDPREFVILLGDGKGGFTRAKLEGIKADPNTNYDITVADVNGDGLQDVLVMYESGAESKFGFQDGSIHVFLNRGTTVAGVAVAPVQAPAKKK